MTATHGARVRFSRFVYQAQGMVSVQCNCPLDCALVRLQVRARQDGTTLETLAQSIVQRRVRLG